MLVKGNCLLIKIMLHVTKRSRRFVEYQDRFICQVYKLIKAKKLEIYYLLLMKP